MDAIRPNSAHVPDHLPNALLCGLTDRIELIVVSEHTLCEMCFKSAAIKAAAISQAASFNCIRHLYAKCDTVGAK
jgi:hypothetical protein